MEVLKISPRGYCYGVVDAITMVKRLAADPQVPRPIHILGMIVHNRHAVEELERLGVITLDGGNRLELLDSVESGTVVFTAHGVSPAVKERARRRGLTCYDATCPDVSVTHDLIRRKAAEGHEIIYIGKRGHPEPEGAMGQAPGRVHLVETEADLVDLQLPPDRITVTTQTTLSQWDTEALIAKIQEKYPQAEIYNEICRATQERQLAAAEQARQVDLVIVVGDPRSNNSNRLVQVVREIAEKPAYLVQTVDDLQPAWFRGVRRVGVTAGSSTPSRLTREVIRFLETYDPEQRSLQDVPGGSGSTHPGI